MFRKIVVGYAQDQAGKDAVCLAAKLAAPLDSDWTVVFPYQPLLSTIPANALEQRAREDVDELTRGVNGLRAPAYQWSPSSWPIHALHEMALHEDADLIVFGSAHAKPTDRLHISLMERMVHAAPSAVAVAPAHYAESGSSELRRIGVGFAASTEGNSALRDGWMLAKQTGGELHVIAGAALEPELASYASAAPNYPEVEQEIYQQTKTALQAATAELGDEVPVRAETIQGQPADVLIERSGGLDILLLGSRAYGPLRHALTGGVSARVMREARCPVLTIPRGVAREHTPTSEREAVAG